MTIKGYSDQVSNDIFHQIQAMIHINDESSFEDEFDLLSYIVWSNIT